MNHGANGTHFDSQPVRMYYTYQEVANILKVSGPTLRFWVGQFKLKLKYMSREYKFSRRDVTQVIEIYHMLRIEYIKLAVAKVRFKARKSRLVNFWYLTNV